MRAQRNNIFLNIDWLLVVLYFLLVGFGLINIYASSTTPEHTYFFDFSAKYGKQIIWIALSFPFIIGILLFNSEFYERFSSILYLISLATLAGLFLFGKKINGAASWYSFGATSIQPSEFAKAFTCLAVAKLLSDRQYNLNILKNQIKAGIIIFLPALLITLQPDPGSAIIYLSFFFVFYREGLNLNYLLLGAFAVVLFIATLYFGAQGVVVVCFSILTALTLYILYNNTHFLRFNWLKVVGIYAAVGLFILGTSFVYNTVFEQHHRDRFDVLLGKKIDTKNIGYNSYQSELAISSGGFWGTGFLEGDRTQGKFVPEQYTDYIFSAVGEEWGFVGSSLVILLFMALLYRIIYLSETHTNKFGRIYGYGIASILFFHLIVNIGMVIGLLPTVGIPLPFFSYGGSSLWGFTVLLFIFIRLDAHKSYDW